MKRVDQMIKYLSGDLSPDESLVFERELKENPQLKEEFSDVSLAYRMIGDQLRKKDEEAFRTAINAAMKRTGSQLNSQKHRGRRPWYLLLGLAAAAALLVTILRTGPGTERIYSAWYNPYDDPVVLAMKENTRGENGPPAAARFWQEGEFERCRGVTEYMLSEDSSDQYALLFNLLCSMELNQPGYLPDPVYSWEADTSRPLGQALTWYRALAMVKSGSASEAADLLAPLAEHPGPYQKDAYKLKKKLIK
jgi:hypothetical protein